nr:hypothetical protein [uncultured Chryseobacterium sp.]
MKKSKKLQRQILKTINGGIGPCYEYCPPGPYGPGQPRSCADYDGLPDCCKKMVMVSFECSGPY